MSSTAAFKPMAGLVLYGATKAFVKDLSLGLRLELSGHGVDVCVVGSGAGGSIMPWEEGRTYVLMIAQMFLSVMLEIGLILMGKQKSDVEC